MSETDTTTGEPHVHEVDVTPDGASLTEVVDGVFAWVQPDGSWWLNNAGGIVGDDGSCLVVDTCATETRTRRFLDALDAATGGAPIRLAVNTHQHGDHTYGNSLLPETTALIGHEHMRAGLAEDFLIDGCPPFWAPTPDWGAVTKRLPNLAIRSDLTAHLGTRRVEIRHPGFTAHTTGDVVAWLPEERVLFTGDLIFHGLTPLVFMGSVSGAHEALMWIAELEPRHVVPGHGPLVEPGALADVLGEHERYYQFVTAVAKEAHRDGLTALAAAQQADLADFAGWADAERIVLNLHRAMADLAGTPMDLVQAFVDAIEWNGGPLTTHVCCLDR